MSHRSSSPTPPLYDPAELQETAELPLEIKKKVLETFYRLDSVDYYQLLGVDRDAGKKAVKDAYYSVVTLFHPDRYYGKELGSYKVKLERVFQRLTEAHATLTRKQLRAEYDRYLQSQDATRALDRLDDARLQDAEAGRLRRQLEREALEAEQIRSSMLPPAPPSESSPPLRRDSSPTLPQLDAEARRQILARKLAGGAGSSVLPARPPAAPTPLTAPARARHEAAAEDLRARYEERLARLRAEQVRRHVDAAEDALGQGNFVAAANSFRLALSLEPDQHQLADRLEAAQRSASAQLADQYLEQARYEERQGHVDRAAISYERAARGRPSATLFNRAAECYLDAGLDLKQASHLAKQAVAMAPREAPPRITLARIYIEAGMAQSALSELERAQELNPSDDGTIKELMKRAKRG